MIWLNNMTKEQLDLLLKYIDSRVQRVARLPEGINYGYSDEELNLRQDLKWTLQDEKEI
jgi:hypothetical protein